MIFQQGDCLIEAVESIPTRAKLRKGRCVLAEGEATGHAHVIEQKGAKLYEGDAGELFLELSKEATVTHEEHGPVTLPPGVYEAGIVREYDHFAEEARQVRD